MTQRHDRIATTAPPTPSPQGPIEVEIVRDTRAFAALEGEWDALYDDAPAATPFQSWAWLFSWWEHYGEESLGLRVVTARDGDGRLVGAIPLMLAPGGRLLFVGAGEANYLDMIARAGWEERVVEAGAEVLRGLLGRGGVADLQDLRPSAVVWGLYRAWGGPKTSVARDGSPVIDLGDGGWKGLLGSLRRKRRSNVRQTLKRAEADEVRGELVGAEAVEEAARRLVELHRESWQGRDIATEHLTRRWESYVVAAARRMTERGLGAICELRRGEELLVSQLLVYGRESDGFLVIGASEKAMERYQVSSLLIREGVNVALSRNAACFDMMQGEEPYKLRWCTRVVPLRRIVLGRSLTTWAPYAGYHVLGARAVRHVKRRVKSEGTPRWVEAAARGAVRRYRALRHTTTKRT